jgi:hypothetical protein
MGVFIRLDAVSNNTLRQRILRQRRRDAGLVKVEVWVRPEQKQAVKALEKELNKEEA